MDSPTVHKDGPAHGVKHLPLGITVKSSTLHRLNHVASGVVLVVAGVLIATHLSPEIGAGLIASGVHQFVVAMLGEKSGEGEMESLLQAAHFPRHAVAAPSRRPAFALDL